MRRRLAEFAFERGGLIALATLALYIWVAPAHVVDGDNAEFATLGTVGGVAHPTGYPLYLLYLRATSWLPGASPAHTTAIATAILGAALVLVLHAAARAWGARSIAASLAVAMFATAPIVLRIHTEAEVFAMNGLVVATILWLAAANGPWRGVLRAAALGAVAGLGLSDHATCALVAPVGILGVIRGAREATTVRAIAAAVAALVLGLVPYAYLFATRESSVSWGHIDDASALLDHVLRRDFGGPGSFSGHGSPVGAAWNLAAFAGSIGRTYLWLPALAGLVALGHRIARTSRHETRVAWALLAASWVLAGPLLALRFDVPPEQFGLYVVRRFHILPALLLAVPVASAIDFIADRITVERMSLALQSVIAAVAFAALAGLALPRLAAEHSPTLEHGLSNIIETAPPRAVIITAFDDLYFGGGYLQEVLGARADVTIVSWPLVLLGWYRDRIAAKGIIVGRGDGVASVRVATAILASGRPLLVDQFERNILENFPSYPYGLLIRALPKGSPQPSLDEVIAINKSLYGRFDLSDPRPGPDDELASEYHRRYAQTWRLLGEALAAANRRDDAAWALGLAQELSPQ